MLDEVPNEVPDELLDWSERKQPLIAGGSVDVLLPLQQSLLVYQNFAPRNRAVNTLMAS
jgi:hypothetical protein